MNHPSVREQLRQFFDIMDSIENLYETYAKSVGLTYAGLLVLDIIYDTPENCTQKFICEQLHFPKQSVNQLIRGLLDNGYVEMKEMDFDRRNKVIKFTPSGQEYADQVMGRLMEAEEAAMGQLSFEQRQGLLQLLQIMKHGFEKNI